MDANDARRSMEQHRAWLSEEMGRALKLDAQFTEQAREARRHYARMAETVAALDRSLDALVRDPRQGGASDGMEVAS